MYITVLYLKQRLKRYLQKKDAFSRVFFIAFEIEITSFQRQRQLP